MIMVLAFLTHLMETDGRFFDQQAKSKASGEDRGSIRHLLMRVIGLIANTESVDEMRISE